MIKIFIAENGEYCYSEKARNGKIAGANETYKTKAGVRKNIRFKLKFWGGTLKAVRWPDGTLEVIDLDMG